MLVSTSSCLLPPALLFPFIFPVRGVKVRESVVYLFYFEFFYPSFSKSKLSVLCHLNLLRNIEFSPKPAKEADVAFLVKDYTSAGCVCTKNTEAGGSQVQGQLGLLGSFQFSLG